MQRPDRLDPAPARADPADRPDVEVAATLEAAAIVGEESFEIAGVGCLPAERLPFSFYGVDERVLRHARVPIESARFGDVRAIERPKVPANDLALIRLRDRVRAHCSPITLTMTRLRR